MAVALDSSKALYSKSTQDTKKNQNNSISDSNTYADSPSRQVRRSARVASLSPSSFTPLINSGTSSTSSSTSSYMPASPSRKYSLMRSGYQGVSIDEITINEIEPVNSNFNKPQSQMMSANLRSNPDRKHPTLDFNPTNLNTPSTTLTNAASSGITPSVKQINLQETPSQRVLEKLVSKGDLEEIAKATPLGNKSVGIGLSSSIATEKGNSSDKNPYYNLSRIQIIQNSNNSADNTKNTSSTSSTSNANNTNNTSNTNNSGYYINTNKTQMVTPKKQTEQQILETGDETVKVVRTLRNRSIVASPIPPRRHSISTATTTTTKNQQFPAISVMFKKHQKNLLAYSLVALFFLATIYHIYDGLTSPSVPFSEPEIIEPQSIPNTVILEDEIVKIISKVSQEQIIPNFELKLQQIEERLQQDKPVDNELLEKISMSVERLEKKFRDFEDKIEGKVKRIESETREQTVKVTKLANEQQRELADLKNEIQEREHRDKELKEKEIREKESKAKDLKEQESKDKQTHTHVQSQAQVHNKRSTERNIETLPLRVVKHLSTSPLSNGLLFKSSQYPPDNALLDNEVPFKFKGNRGKFAVLLPPNQSKLPSKIVIQQPMLPDRSCAPRDIEIWGLINPLNERDSPVLLGKGRFDLATSEQSFNINGKGVFKVLQLRIRNNHGNDQFTCLYRFKVIQ